jgi:hypothetical protein
MKSINSVVAVVAMAAAVVSSGQNATAQEEVTPQFKLAPNVLAKQQWFEVQIQEGTCPGGAVGVTSPGFLAPVKAGDIHGQAGATPGTYTATLKCKGTSKTGTAEYEVLDRNVRPRFVITPSTLTPGQWFEVQIEKGDCPGGGTVHSDGFRKDLPAGDLHGMAADRPGKYIATLTCSGGYRGATEFEIVAPPIKPVPTTPPAKAKAPVVKPKGAPQTGGGGTA